jgi:hypothetical protein
MPKNSSRYRGPAERAERRAKTPAKPMGRFRRIRGLASAVGSRIHRPHPRREVVIVGSLALAVVIGVGSIGGAYLLYRSNHDWTSVASVNGHDISREQLRGRMAVLSLLAKERTQFIEGAVAAGYATSDEASTVQSADAAMTSIEAARQSLIGDELLRQLAARDGVATPASPDPWVEAAAYATSEVAHRVRYLRFGVADSNSSTSGSTNASGTATPWPAANLANLDAAAARVRSELLANTPAATIVADLHDAGWQVFGEDVAVSTDGSTADPTVDLDSTVAASAIRGQPGDLVGPTTDAYGQVAMGMLLPTMDTSHTLHQLSPDAAKANVDTAAVQSWADGQALRRAVTAHLIAAWSKGVAEAHFRELVVGTAPDSSGTAGPWVELSGLYTDQLSGITSSSIAGAPAGLDLGADSLARSLKSMAATDRPALFRALVAAAKAATAPKTTNVSGEIGFFGEGEIAPEVGAAAFADSTHVDDVIGPVSTAAGPELYLVEARYSGTLDARSKVALSSVRDDPSPDLSAYAKLYSPTDVALASDSGWIAEPELSPDDSARSAIFDTAVGVLSDPFVLDGNLALAIVTERKTAVPDARTLDRLILAGYTVWFDAEYAKATITESDNPLPELAPSASASAAT